MKSLTLVTTLLLFAGCGIRTDHASTNNNSNKSQTASAENKTEGWQTVRWEKQGMTFTLPPDWRKDDSFPDNEAKEGEFLTSSSLTWTGPLKQSLEVSVQTGAKDFPMSAEEMLEKDYEIDQGLKREGKIPIEDLRYLEIDGVKGEYFRQDTQRLKLSWITYRHYNGKAQHLFVTLHGPQEGLDMLLKILNSTKVAHE